MSFRRKKKKRKKKLYERPRDTTRVHFFVLTFCTLSFLLQLSATVISEKQKFLTRLKRNLLNFICFTIKERIRIKQVRFFFFLILWRLKVLSQPKKQQKFFKSPGFHEWQTKKASFPKTRIIRCRMKRCSVSQRREPSSIIRFDSSIKWQANLRVDPSKSR